MSYEIINYNARRWIKQGDRLLAGYNCNDLRAYLFPLYTPNGGLVLQEAPPDHRHHQGLWAGLEIDGHDLWNAGSFGKLRHQQCSVQPLNEINTAIDARGCLLTHDLSWSTAAAEVLLYERRIVRVSSEPDFTLVQWYSTFSHPDKTTTLGQTKESGIAIRIPPHWETAFGGTIRNAQGEFGETNTFDRPSPWVNVEGSVVGAVKAGVVLAISADSELCTWFTRDYGIHVYNPARHRVITLIPGDTLTWSIKLLAYDGAQSIEQINGWVDSIQ